MQQMYIEMSQQKKAPALDFWLSLAKYFFPKQTSKVKLKKIKTSKVIVLLTIKTCYFT